MESKQDFVARFAGEGGQGMVTAAEGLAQAASQVGYHVLTYSTFPSQILGGPTFAQVRIGATPILGPGDYLDVLVAFNREAYDIHRDEVRDGGVIIYNSEEFQLEPDNHSLGMAFSELAKSTGNARAENMIVIGAFAQLVGMPQEYLEKFVVTRFSRGRAGDEEIIRSNIQALSLGRTEGGKSGFSVGVLPEPHKPDYPQILIKGNDAISVGAIAAGLDVYIGYPISPATPILIYMERNLIGPGKFTYQASSEIEAINAITGAGYAGKKAMTATAGPGFSLMSEGIGLGWMAEIPTVIVDVQRGGPATGLPTKTEQSDLYQAVFGRNADTPVPVVASCTAGDCFYTAIEAVRLATKYMTPVILLTDGYLANAAEPWLIPNADEIADFPVKFRTDPEGFHPYLRDEKTLARNWAIPGTPGLVPRIGGIEKDYDSGHISYEAANHHRMTKVRAEKVANIANDIPLQSVAYGAERGKLAVVGWGSTYGAINQAVRRSRDKGLDVSHIHIRHIFPLPKNLGGLLKGYEKVLIPEMNNGQLVTLLRATYLVDAESMTQISGQPYKVSDLEAAIRACVEK